MDNDNAPSESSPCLVLDAVSPAVLGASVIERLRQLATQHPSVPAGTTLYRQGEPFQAIYAVRVGAVKTVVNDAAGDGQVLSFRLPGEFFGLTAIHAGHYVNTAIALERTAVCSLSYPALSRVADEHPALRRQLMRLMSGVILNEQDAHAALAGHAAPARLAFILLALRRRMPEPEASAETLRLPMSRADLGQSVGLTPETTSRVFGQFRRHGLIDASGRRVRFLDTVRLQAMAASISPAAPSRQVPQNVAGTTSANDGGRCSQAADGGG